MIDIVNHSVKIDDIGLLQFMYPDYIILDKPILFIDKPIIFKGETKYINQIKSLGVDYIIITELAEIDLTRREVLLEVVFAAIRLESTRPSPIIYAIRVAPAMMIEVASAIWLSEKPNAIKSGVTKPTTAAQNLREVSFCFQSILVFIVLFSFIENWFNQKNI